MSTLWMLLVLVGAALLVALVIAHERGYRGRVWPWWALLAVLCLVIGTVWPTGA